MILWRRKSLQVIYSIVIVSILLSSLQSRSVVRKIITNEEKSDTSSPDDDMSFIQGFLSGDLSLGAGGQLDLTSIEETLLQKDKDNGELIRNKEEKVSFTAKDGINLVSRRANSHSRTEDERNLFGAEEENKSLDADVPKGENEHSNRDLIPQDNSDGSEKEKLTESVNPWESNQQIVSYGRENKMDMDTSVSLRDDIKAKDRSLFIPFNPVSLEYIEAKYESLVVLLPSLIDEAREVIIEDVATKNMIGYSFVFAYIIGASFDTIGLTLLTKQSMWDAIVQLVTNKEYFGFVWAFWWYCFGYAGPWMFPTTFSSTGGVTNLRCSSEDYFQLFLDHDLTLNIQSFTEKSPAENIILTSRLSRDFNLRLACVVNKRGDHREAAKVSQTFQSLLYLVSLHGQLDTRELPETGYHDLAILDAELENAWGEIILLTDQAMNIQ